MSESLAEPLSLHTRLADVDGMVAVEYDVKRAPTLIFEFDQRTEETVRVKISRPEMQEYRYRRKVPLTQELGDIAARALDEKPLRAVKVAEGGKIKQVPLGVPVDQIFYWVSVAMLAWGFVAREWLMLVFAAGMLLVAAGFTLSNRLRPKLQPSQFIHKLGTVRINELTSIAPEPQLGDPTTHADVAAVKEEYGALLSDLRYRIEHPALFDVAVPTTRAFTTALLRWDDTSSSIPAGEAAELAARVRLTFDAAKTHAEMVGTDHMASADRDAVRRAASALRLAESTTNPAERTAARRQAIRILGSLALYYLPDEGEALDMLEGRQILALPGRRSEPT